MQWNDVNHYFTKPVTGLAEPLFANIDSLFNPLERLKPFIEDFFKGKRDEGSIKAAKQRYQTPSGATERSVFIKETITLKQDFIDKKGKIFIQKGVMLEAGATIKDHCIILEGSEVRQGAYLRGNLFIGPKCVAGHTTEMKNCILLEHVEAGHFTYLGDSILGHNINLGAGTKVSNLEFRSLAQKQGFEFPQMSLNIDGQKVPSGKNKFGAFIGDGFEAGCNSVISPLSFIMKECWLLPNVTLPKGVYRPNQILKNIEDCKKARL